MVGFVLFAVARQRQQGPLFHAEGVETGLLLVLEDRAAADGGLLQGGEAGGGDAGEKDDQQDRDQRDPALALEAGTRVRRPNAAARRVSRAEAAAG